VENRNEVEVFNDRVSATNTGSIPASLLRDRVSLRTSFNIPSACCGEPLFCGHDRTACLSWTADTTTTAVSTRRLDAGA